MRYVLASGSPRRKELLSKVIGEFEIIPAVSEEESGKQVPSEIVTDLSFQKASEIFNRILMDSSDRLVVIGADTIVSYNHKVLGKPKDRKDAFEMIKSFQGKVHSVYTGITVFYMEEGSAKSFTFSECTDVKVSVMTDEEICEYVNTGESDDKAGAYGIQGVFAKFIEKIDGDYYNVVGLPVARLYKELKNNALI
ncbi:MAG: Maf family protein [Butyrivibrio sp.]|nr:Maf family protein [Butyrivibrio sp.]